MKIENAKTTFFKSKEEYLAFRKAWAAACNSPERKSTLVETDWGIQRESGNLTATHHYIFLLLCGKDVMSSFKPITNTIKLSNGMREHQGLYYAFNMLSYKANQILSFQGEKDKTKSWVINYNKDVDEFLKPFGGTVTHDMLIDLNTQGKKAWDTYCKALKEAA